MAFFGPRVDPRARRAAGAARYRSDAPVVGPVLGHSHGLHTDRAGLHHVVGGDRRQSVRRRGSLGDGRTAARHRISSVDRARRPHAAILRYRPVRHGGHRHRKRPVHSNGSRKPRKALNRHRRPVHRVMSGGGPKSNCTPGPPRLCL